MAINKGDSIIASVAGPGYLSAHLNMSDRPKEREHKKNVRLVGMETGQTETVHLEWPSVELQVDDVVELRVLPDGDGTTPSEIRKTSESPYNLFSNEELAKEMVLAITDFESRVSELLEKSKGLESPDEYKKIVRAYTSVVWELGQNLLHPIYRKHQELIPDELKGELL